MATQLLNGIAVEIDGEGDALLCIHGLGGSSNVWTPVMAALEGFKVIRPDLPGSARSGLPAERLSIDVYVTALERLLADLNIASIHIAAHSLGSIVAQHFTLGNASRVKSLALFGPLLAPPDAGRPAIAARAQLARTGLSGMQQIADAIASGATSKETKAQNPAALALIRESVMRQSSEGYAQSCEALAEAQAAAVEGLQVPTLLVTGDQDGVAPVANVHAMAECIQNSRVVALEGCGHWATFEKPQACRQALQAFLAGVR
jgi:3-oxoadipate enol-lactonase